MALLQDKSWSNIYYIEQISTLGVFNIPRINIWFLWKIGGQGWWVGKRFDLGWAWMFSLCPAHSSCLFLSPPPHSSRLFSLLPLIPHAYFSLLPPHSSRLFFSPPPHSFCLLLSPPPYFLSPISLQPSAYQNFKKAAKYLRVVQYTQLDSIRL